MAPRKSTKTSKTDHVLNLLSASRPAESPREPETAQPQADTAAADRATPAAPTPSAGRLPPVLEVARTNHEALSNTIHDALEAALAEELTREAAPETPEPPETAPALEAPPENAPAAETPPEPAAAPETAEEVREPEPEDTSEEVHEASAAEPAAGASDPDRLPDGARMINVMEALVEEKLDRYVRMFHLCTCPRCLADTRALALTRLPAKYVVVPEQAAAPMMGLYRSRFDSEVTTQILYACKAVMDAPRHQTGEP